MGGRPPSLEIEAWREGVTRKASWSYDQSARSHFHPRSGRQPALAAFTFATSVGPTARRIPEISASISASKASRMTGRGVADSSSTTATRSPSSAGRFVWPDTTRCRSRTPDSRPWPMKPSPSGLRICRQCRASHRRSRNGSRGGSMSCWAKAKRLKCFATSAIKYMNGRATILHGTKSFAASRRYSM